MNTKTSSSVIEADHQYDMIRKRVNLLLMGSLAIIVLVDVMKDAQYAFSTYMTAFL